MPFGIMDALRVPKCLAGTNGRGRPVNKAETSIPSKSFLSGLQREDGAAIGTSLAGRLETRFRRRAMKRRIALGAVVAAVALMGSMDSAKADHCQTYRPSYSSGHSSSYYQPSYSYGHSTNYYRPSQSFGQRSYRPSYGYSQPSFGYSRPGFSISIGSGRSGFSFGRSYGHSSRRSHSGHRH
jgi:hypothetical protein